MLPHCPLQPSAAPWLPKPAAKNRPRQNPRIFERSFSEPVYRSLPEGRNHFRGNLFDHGCTHQRREKPSDDGTNPGSKSFPRQLMGILSRWQFGGCGSRPALEIKGIKQKTHKPNAFLFRLPCAFLVVPNKKQKTGNIKGRRWGKLC